MEGPHYPANSGAPAVRFYTDYGMQTTLVKPPYATLTAYDLNTATIKWQVPSGGDEPRAVEDGASNTGYPQARTGIINTATGLLFQAGRDGKLRAYEAESGRVLWTGELPAGSIGIPAMYEVNGKQYLLINATQGGGGGRGAAPAEDEPTRGYVAFALP
jgi:quinoprotein glucose dehydrogenase